jgi:hypothetical protein
MKKILSVQSAMVKHGEKEKGEGRSSISAKYVVNGFKLIGQKGLTESSFSNFILMGYPLEL